jgi:DNA-directed RNA polymerase II subunit RPB2
MKKVTITRGRDGEDGEDGEEVEEEVESYDKVFIGEVPIMLRSGFCSLYDRTDKDLTELGECPYDQVGSCFVG